MSRPRRHSYRDAAAGSTPVGSFFDAVVGAGGTISAGRRTLYTNLFNSLASGGFLTMLNRLGILAAENPTTAQIDLITGQRLVLAGNPTFTVDQGYNGGLAGQWIDTLADPTIMSLMKQDSSSFGAGTLTARSAGADTVLIGNVQINGSYGLWPNTTFPAVAADSSDNPFSSGFALPNATIKGLWHIIRSVPGTRVTCINGIQAQSVANTTAPPTPGKSFLLFAWRNTDGITPYAFSGDNCCLWFCGAPFTVPQALAFSNILNTYMTAIGNPLY